MFANRCCVQVLEPQFRQPFQNVNRWFTTLVHQPQFEAVIGNNFSLCEKMAQFDGTLPFFCVHVQFCTLLMSVLCYYSTDTDMKQLLQCFYVSVDFSEAT